MKALFLSQRVPYPPDRGDKISSWRLVERLSRHHEVTILAFSHDESDEAGAEALRAKGFEVIAIPHDERAKKIASLPLLLSGTPLTLGVYGSKELQAEVDRRAKDADFALAFSSSMGAFLMPHPELPKLVFIGELDSDKWRQYAAVKSFPMSWVYRREARTLFSFEKKLAGAAEESLLVTPLEKEIFDREIPGCRSSLLRNGVDLELFHPTPERAEPGHLVFTGVMDYFPNTEGCAWFVHEVFPLIRQRHPDARFSIVGSKPDKGTLELASEPGVTVTGRVDSTADWLQRAAVAVCPLNIARGVQNKVLEAMSCGLGVVATTQASQGTEAIPGDHFLLADEATTFATEVANLLDYPERARELGTAARAFMEETRSWERNYEALDSAVERITQSKP
jgi:sugar transferase (PEP-CTERM/EpsH1 system associated)